MFSRAVSRWDEDRFQYRPVAPTPATAPVLAFVVEQQGRFLPEGQEMRVVWRGRLDRRTGVVSLAPPGGDVAKAVKMCSAANAPLARIVQAGLVKVNRPDEEVQAAMDEAALRELPKIAKRTAFLALLANLAMLSGLLGTVTGLITSFGAVSGESVDPGQKARILAEGISEAMHCTWFGLAVAIVALIGFALLNGKTQQLEDDINEASVQVLNLVVTNRQKVNLSNLSAAA